MQKWLQHFDHILLKRLHKIEMPLARLSIFIVYFWFGILKLFDISPAKSLVQSLFDQTLYFIPFAPFYIFFSAFEMLIGVLFLLKGYERIALLLLVIHLICTILPLFVLPAATWQGVFVPTLEGQYIIKNILITALAVVIGSRMAPMRSK